MPADLPAQVSGWQHVPSLKHTWLPEHGEHVSEPPHPFETGRHPAVGSCWHVLGVQHALP
jgi:hypothetical protein